MPRRYERRIKFTEEMDRDFEQIRDMFRKSYNIEPSNSELQAFLLNIFKKNTFEVHKKPRSRVLEIRW